MKLFVDRVFIQPCRKLPYLSLKRRNFLLGLFDSLLHGSDPNVRHVGLVRNLLLHGTKIKNRLLRILNLLDRGLALLFVDSQTGILVFQVLLKLVNLSLQTPSALVDVAQSRVQCAILVSAVSNI